MTKATTPDSTMAVYPEVGFYSGAALDAPGDLLPKVQQVFQRVDEVVDSREGEHGHQISGVGGHHDQDEQPPDADHKPA